jgi:hypothetical protein
MRPVSKKSRRQAGLIAVLLFAMHYYAAKAAAFAVEGSPPKRLDKAAM